MNFKEKLDQKRRSANAVFHEFRLRSDLKDKYFIFVEGYDDRTLLGNIVLRYRNGKDVEFIICFGKRNLDRIVNMIDSESFSSVKRRFVRDRDFDVFMGMADDAEDIFLTCGYSIENYLIVEEDIRRFIVNTFCESIQGWQSYVDQELEKLFMLIKLLHVRLERLYAFCFSKIGTGEVVNLDTISFRKIIAKYEVSIRDFELYVDQGVASIVDEDFVEEEKFDIFFDKAREYVEGCSEKRVRGKYLLGVLAEFLEHIYEKMKENNLSEQYGKINVRRNAMINFSDRYVFERLSGNFVVPVRFENFLREYLS